MNVPYTVKVPVDVAMALKDREARMRRDLMRDLERGGNLEPKERRAIMEKIKHVSLQNLLRLALMAGFPVVTRMSDEAALDKLMAGGVARGRPRRAA